MGRVLSRSPAEAGHLGTRCIPPPRGRAPAGFSCAFPERVPPLAGRHPRLSVVPLAGFDRGGAFGSKALLHRRVRNVPGSLPNLEYPILPWAWFPSKVPSRSCEPSWALVTSLAGGPSGLRRVRIPLPLRLADLGVVSRRSAGAVFRVCPIGGLRLSPASP